MTNAGNKIKQDTVLQGWGGAGGGWRKRLEKGLSKQRVGPRKYQVLFWGLCFPS